MTDRRQILKIAAISAVSFPVASACTSDVLPFASQPPPTPDAQQNAEIALVAAYDAAIAGLGGGAGAEALAATYQRIRDQHAEHVRAMGWEQTLPEATPASSPRSPSRRQLIAKEQAALRRHTRNAGAAGEAGDGEQAQILALIAASEAQHVVTLGSL